MRTEPAFYNVCFMAQNGHSNVFFITLNEPPQPCKLIGEQMCNYKTIICFARSGLRRSRL